MLDKQEMQKEWQPNKIEELCLKITSGGTPSRKNPSFYENGTINWIKTGELKDWYINSSSEKITLEAIDKSSAKIFPSKTVLLAMYGDGRTIGSLGILKHSAATNQACCAMILDETKCIPLFLFYSLMFNREKLISLALGGSQRNLNAKTVRNFTIKIPSIPTQQKIASILSAYDDLIENNTRRIQILEEMARRIYEEWFVHFRFPNHENIKLVESELGLIPEGWEVKTLIDTCDILMGQSPPSSSYNENGEGLPFHQGVTDFGDRFPTDKKFCKITNRLARDGDILFSVRAPVGRLNIATKDIIIGRGLSSIRSKKGNQCFLFQQLKHMFQEEDIIGNGSIFKSVTKTEMHNILLLKPFDETVRKFEAIVMLIFRNLRLLTDKNSNLRKTRDLLLPKLISGEIDVSEFPDAS